MRKILITGENSYIGTQFENYIKNWMDEYSVDTVDMIDGSWREKSFSGYDAVFHVAGLAHVNKKTREYYDINTDLTIETAKKAKADGVGQFIFMSSIIVYGESAPMGKAKVIDMDTVPEPVNFYGDSKLQAEKGIEPFSDDKFKVVIIRSPMVYGKGSKGNYYILAKIARKIPIFPDIKNQRSMLYIGNLCEFVKLMIDKKEAGTFFPQNSEYVCTTQMVKEIADVYGKHIHFTKLLNPFVQIAGKIPGRVGGLANKAFGNLAYDMNMSRYEDDYTKYQLSSSVKATET